jgi:hypothetical protein
MGSFTIVVPQKKKKKFSIILRLHFTNNIYMTKI